MVVNKNFDQESLSIAALYNFSFHRPLKKSNKHDQQCEYIYIEQKKNEMNADEEATTVNNNHQNSKANLLSQ